MAGYIGSKASVVSSGAERKKVFSITTTTTSLTGLVYTPNQVHVYHNGIRLVDGTDYTATNGTTITLTTAAENGDQVVVLSYATFQPSDTVSASAGGTFNNDVNIIGDLGIGTATPATKAEISGSSSAACLFTATVTGTTLDVTAVSSGALAVGQYLLNTNQRVRITALGTGTGGVGTYTLDSDQTGNSFQASYVLEPVTLRLGNSATTFGRSMPFGAVEFGGAVTNVGTRGFIQVGAAQSSSSAALGTILFGSGPANGSSPPRSVMSLAPTIALLPAGLTLGVSGLSPRNLTISPAILSFHGRSQTLYTSGASLSSMNFFTSYIDGGVETSATYGNIGYLVDSSITSGQLPSNFYISTRNASGTTAERFRIDKDGSVGIGTSTPGSKVEIFSPASAIGVGNFALNTNSTSGASRISFKESGSTVGQVAYSHDNNNLELIANESGSGIVFYTDGTNERMRINSSGLVTIPNQPMFQAGSSTSDITYTTGAIIPFNTKRFDRGNNFNTSTYRFTAPVAGAYFFITSVYAFTGRVALSLFINGVQATGTGGDVTPYAFKADSTALNDLTVGFTYHVILNAGDYVSVNVRDGYSTRLYGGHSTFSGHFLG